MEITEVQLNQLDQSGFFKIDQVISKKEFQEIRTRMENITQRPNTVFRNVVSIRWK